MSERYARAMIYIQNGAAITDSICHEEEAISGAQLALDLRQGKTDLKKSVEEYREWLGKFANGSNSFYFCDFGPFRIYNMPANTPADSPIFEENMERYRQDITWRFRDLERAYEGISTSDIKAEIENRRKTIEELKRQQEEERKSYKAQ